jgi:hypothetical protein
MSVDDVEEPRVADSEETIDERNGDTEGPLLSEVTGSNTQDPEGEPGEDFHPSSSENIVSNDQEEKEEIDLVKATKDLEKEKARQERKGPRPAQDKLTSKLQSELKKQIDRTRSLQDAIKGIQRQLVRIDKTLYSVKKEHEVIRKKHGQFNSLQKRVDSIDKSIRSWKSKPKAAKRKTKPKLTKKKNK